MIYARRVLLVISTSNNILYTMERSNHTQTALSARRSSEDLVRVMGVGRALLVAEQRQADDEGSNAEAQDSSELVIVGQSGLSLWGHMQQREQFRRRQVNQIPRSICQNDSNN